MNKDLTEVIFLLDRSGSMVDLTSDTIGGYNSFIEKQQKESGKAILTTVLFDDRYQLLHDGVDIRKVKELTTKEYFARGSTALLDAIGKTIITVGNRLSNTKESDRPSKVILVLTTDGMENASVEFTKSKIKDMIDTQTNIYKWEFIFLGANFDAISFGNNLGIFKSATYSGTSLGTQSVYNTVSDSVTNYRNTGSIDPNWANEIK